jgi:hypothetical protein
VRANKQLPDKTISQGKRMIVPGDEFAMKMTAARSSGLVSNRAIRTGGVPSSGKARSRRTLITSIDGHRWYPQRDQTEKGRE